MITFPTVNNCFTKGKYAVIQLRDYQEVFKAQVLTAWETHRSVLGVLPTGGGKTVTFASIVSEHKGAAIIVVHRREILSQISQAVALVSEDLAGQGRMHRVVAPAKTIAMIRRKHLDKFGKCFIDPQAQVGVASVQTLTSPSTGKDARLQAWFSQVTLAVFDEGHHYVEAGFWARAVKLFDMAKLLFVTATPERADGTGLGKGHGGFADVMVEGPTPRQLIDWGHLCRYDYFCPESDFDVGGVAVTDKGDFNATAMRSRVVESHLVGDLVRHYLRLAKGTQGICFVESIATAEEVAARFNASGVSAVALSGKTEEGERERALQDFETGKILMLINVDLFDEGFNVPAATTCIIGRATMSLAKYMQMVGRVLRTAKGKEKAIIIDPVRNWERHGQVTWPRQWSLKGREKGEGSNLDKPKQKVCTGCSQLYEAFRLLCPYCGEVPEPAERKTPEEVDGDLTALDLDALESLFAGREEANQTDEEFQRGLFARHVPTIGHNSQLKRFRATKYRRDVLRNLIGWWVGAQPEGRTTVEIQKRFYSRFGVDMLTAETLGLKETDDLIEKVAKRFDKDMLGG
jgi:DNA repair protein RadD